MTDNDTSLPRKAAPAMTNEKVSRLLAVAMKDAARKINQNLKPGEEPFVLSPLIDPPDDHL